MGPFRRSRLSQQQRANAKANVTGTSAEPNQEVKKGGRGKKETQQQQQQSRGRSERWPDASVRIADPRSWCVPAVRDRDRDQDQDPQRQRLIFKGGRCASSATGSPRRRPPALIKIEDGDQLGAQPSSVPGLRGPRCAGLRGRPAGQRRRRPLHERRESGRGVVPRAGPGPR